MEYFYIVFNKIYNYILTLTTQVENDANVCRLEVDSEFKQLKNKVPASIKSSSELSRAHITIEHTLKEKFEGYFTPKYLYKICKGNNYAYILGTNHAIPLELFSTKLFECIHDSKVFVSEVKIYEPEIDNDCPEEDLETINHLNPDSVTLPAWADSLSSYDKNFLMTFWPYDMPFNEMDPYTLYTELEEIILREAMGNGMDSGLAKYFASNQLGDLKYLENEEERQECERLCYEVDSIEKSKISNDLGEKDSYYIDMIDSTITWLCNGQNYNFAARLVRKIFGIESYIHGNITFMYEYLEGKTPLDEDPSTNQRTKNWLPKIDELIAQNENAFIAVGVQHVIGPSGIIKHYSESSEYEIFDMSSSDTCF